MARTKIPKPIIKSIASTHRALYRLSKGRIGAKFNGGAVALLTTTGRRSGKERTTPLTTVEHDSGWVLIASYSGHDHHPAWYLNLQAKPEATLTLGTRVHRVHAVDLEGVSRDEAWRKMTAVWPDYDAYQQVTDRVIPVVHLTAPPDNDRT